MLAERIERARGRLEESLRGVGDRARFDAGSSEFDDLVVDIDTDRADLVARAAGRAGPERIGIEAAGQLVAVAGAP